MSPSPRMAGRSARTTFSETSATLCGPVEALALADWLSFCVRRRGRRKPDHLDVFRDSRAMGSSLGSLERYEAVAQRLIQAYAVDGCTVSHRTPTRAPTHPQCQPAQLDPSVPSRCPAKACPSPTLKPLLV